MKKKKKKLNHRKSELKTVAFNLSNSSTAHGILQARGLPCPPPGNLPDPGIKPASLCLLHWQVGSLLLVTPGKLHYK